MDAEAREAITIARIQLMRFHPFFGFLAMHLQPEEYDHPTAGTDGVHLFYNPETVKQWHKDGTLTGVISHEVLHAAVGHIFRRENREPARWNVSADYATNPLVTAEGLKLPPGALLDNNFKGMSAEQIYNQLPPQATWDTFCEGVMQPAPAGEGEGLKPLNDEKDGQAGEGQGEGAGDGDKDKQCQDTGTGLQNTEGAWRRRLVQAAEAAKSQGKLPADIERLVGEVVNPVLPWREILRNLVNTMAKGDYRTMPPAKNHIWRGFYLPSVRSESIELVVALDTSGSIGQDELNSFANEVRGMAEVLGDYTIHLLACDAQVHGIWELTPFNVEVPKRFGGGGGTCFRPVFDWIEEKELRPACLIYFTDAMGSFPDHEPPYPVIWVLTEQCAEVPWGYAIQTDFANQRRVRR